MIAQQEHRAAIDELVGPEPKMTTRPEPYLEFLEWIFTGDWRSRSYLKPLSADQRIDWMRRNLPRTYALLTAKHRWADLSDI